MGRGKIKKTQVDVVHMNIHFVITWVMKGDMLSHIHQHMYYVNAVELSKPNYKYVYIVV